MELFMQFLIGSAISSFAILIIFAGISPFELLLQSISSINLKLKEFCYLSLIIWILGWLLKLEIRVKISEEPSALSNIPKCFLMLTKWLLKVSEISESLFKILSVSTNMILSSLQIPLSVK